MRSYNIDKSDLAATTIPRTRWIQAVSGPTPFSIETFIITLHQGYRRLGHDNQWHGCYPARALRRGMRTA
jgi:hypothetical protein